ncbi:MAG: hypothetical protein UV73_C0014G0003 [Candidatus Gottesmanbacteria bacterium GW2011_GWA2_43_14]|uniref:LytR/CpsA/Psr regulator C-terminal domain-containing protein n=1 Tax=Candidatus Gottesmanbacteria bacterium GW2011_GWA2_43_14 TaxID=1618443 RepID=A0A0G1FL09_9BACT|nr:MAG: hypothetical protein UV73_C0014G0003 [Candidatus Gottesmanbacteria bacterium GW2011_GWA2_43_14]
MAFPGLKLPVILRNRTVIIVSILLVLISLPSLFFFMKFREAEKVLNDLDSGGEAKIIAKVGSLIELPKGEYPTVATVTDKTKLANLAFFSNAKNGDIVLAYQTAKKAILYDPKINKIIEVANFSRNTPTPTPAAEDNITFAPVSLLLLNGTKTAGLTLKYETELRQKIATVSVIARQDARKNDYPKTLLIDLDEDQSEIAQKLGKDLGIPLSLLPLGETASGGADFAIIVGEDKI